MKEQSLLLKTHKDSSFITPKQYKVLYELYLVVLLECKALGSKGLPRRVAPIVFSWVFRGRIGLGALPDVLSVLAEVASLGAWASSASAHGWVLEVNPEKKAAVGFCCGSMCCWGFGGTKGFLCPYCSLGFGRFRFGLLYLHRFHLSILLAHYKNLYLFGYFLFFCFSIS